MSQENPLPDNRIAVIGMAGRFPGAGSLAAYWDNLLAGRESIASLSDAELAASGVPDHLLTDPAYVKRAATIDGVDEFDAELFGFTPQTARTTDPQQRLFLQSAWHALEDAGYAPGGVSEPVGVFAAGTTSGYLLHNLLSHHDSHEIMGYGANMTMVSLAFANDKDYLATRVSHALDLSGPSLAVQSACSSSLLAVHLACQSLLTGECDMALAGGVSLRMPHRMGYLHEPGSIVSPDGHCRAFDAGASGTVFGSGVGVVALKPLALALADGDPVRAVIRGSAVNNDGARKMGFSAPSVLMQAEVVAEAMAVAETEPDEVGYLEAHGTGTPLGDPVEFAALRRAFAGRAGGRPCRIGSVKPNIGHLEVASGIAGLIKTVLALEHRTLPGLLHYQSPNPELDLDGAPFALTPETSRWDSDTPRVAGISSLGVGGTNVHVVLEEKPEAEPAPPAASGPQVLLLSARTSASLNRMRASLGAHVEEHVEAGGLRDVAYTLAEGRAAQPHRVAVVAARPVDAAEALRTPGHEAVHTGAAVDRAGENQVAFLYSGQGAQYPGMTAGLYRYSRVFREQVDACAELFTRYLGTDPREVILAGDEAAARRTDLAQPALFTVGHALTQLLAEYGVQPSAVAGHSVGEYAAAVAAGVFELADAAWLVAQRGRLMQGTTPGQMASVPLPEEDVTPLLAGTGLAVAAVNEPDSTVVAGPGAAVRSLVEDLGRRGVSARHLHTDHGFHSALMDPVVAELRELVGTVATAPPKLPLTSNTTGAWMTSAEARDPDRWAGQVRSTVRFADNLTELLAEPGRVLVELGPGRTLTAAARRHPRWRDTHRLVRLVRHRDETAEDPETFLLGLGRLWGAGVDLDWSPQWNGTSPRRRSLPGYAFEPTRHWIEPAAAPRDRAAGAPAYATLDTVVADDSGGAVDDGFTTSTERTLATLVRGLLGVDRVDREDNFFDLGGDSVVAVQLAAQAGKSGLRLTPKDVFDHQTIAALARAVSADTPDAEPMLVAEQPEGAQPALTPAHWRFFGSGMRPADSWRVPLLLRLDRDVSPEGVAAALTALVSRHEALRLRFSERHGLIEQTVTEPPEEVALAVLRPSSLDALAASLGTEGDGEPEAPLRAAYLLPQDESGTAYLALSLHHLSVDNDSQRILLGDLDLALRQVSEGQPIELAPVSTPWRAWTNQVAALAGHPEIQSERAHWLAPEPAGVAALAVPPTGTPPVAEDYASVLRGLTAAQTEELTARQRERHQPLEDLLLDALAQTVTRLVGGERILVDVEGTARAVRLNGVDLSRTVGWCTTLYPRVVEPGTDPVPVPREGLGYGLLRHLYGPTAGLLAQRRGADLLLAYLGSTDGAGEEWSHGVVTPVLDRVLPARSTPPGLGYGIELRAYAHDGRLFLDWWFDQRRVDGALVDKLASALVDQLAAPAAPLVDLDEEGMADLLAELGGEERSER